MDHLVHVDSAAKEMDLLIRKKKTMILRSSMSRRDPYQKVKKGDILFFISNKGPREIHAKGTAAEVEYLDVDTWEDSFRIIDSYQPQLLLNIAQKKKYAGKRYLSLIVVEDVKPYESRIPILMDIPSDNDWVVLDGNKVNILPEKVFK